MKSKDSARVSGMFGQALDKGGIDPAAASERSRLGWESRQRAAETAPSKPTGPSDHVSSALGHLKAAGAAGVSEADKNSALTRAHGEVKRALSAVEQKYSSEGNNEKRTRLADLSNQLRDALGAIKDVGVRGGGIDAAQDALSSVDMTVLSSETPAALKEPKTVFKPEQMQAKGGPEKVKNAARRAGEKLEAAGFKRVEDAPTYGGGGWMGADTVYEHSDGRKFRISTSHGETIRDNRMTISEESKKDASATLGNALFPSWTKSMKLAPPDPLANQRNSDR